MTTLGALGRLACSTVLAGATLLGLAGCGGDEEPKTNGGDGGPGCTFDLAWGHATPTGDWLEFGDGEDAEITLGFQGFRYVESVLKLSGVSAPSAEFSVRVSVSGQEPYTLPATPVKLSAGAGGALYSEAALVFFNDLPIADLVGQNAEIAVHAEAGGCVGDSHTAVVLRDDVDCVQQPDGSLVCSGTDGGTDGGDASTPDAGDAGVGDGSGDA